MKRKLMFGIAMLVFMVTACKNPFLPGKEEKIITPVYLAYDDVSVILVDDSGLSDVECLKDEEVILTVGVEGNEEDYLCMWYSNTENSNEDGTPIDNAVNTTFNPPTYETGTMYYYAVITDKRNGETTASKPVKVTVNARVYIIAVDIIDNEEGDTVTASPDTGKEGDIVTLTYTVADIAHYNLLDFSGVIEAIDSVNSAGDGERTYTINAADASGGVITITAIFEHTDLVIDHIAFNNTGHINKTYGDAVFTNAVAEGYSGSGAITYSSSDTSVATVDSFGQVTIRKAGSAVITAEKAADAVYAYAQTDYTLAVNPKIVTITGLSASNKVYDGTTAATVTGTAVISGLVSGDTVTVKAGTAAFANASIGHDKTVTFSGWSLTGADSGNYTLLAQPTSVTACITPLGMVCVPAGTFTMGSPASEPNRYDDEGPQHSVTITKSFFMGKYQVTQEQYQAVMGSNPSNFTSAVAGESGTPGKLPVERVSWYDTLVFCNKLSVMEGLSPAYSISGSTDPAAWGAVPTSNNNATWDAVVIVAGSTGYRLPTEAQWEYACRAGTTTAYNTGASISDNTGWYSSNSGSKTHQVGLKPANAWGLYDMHGNVYEWCWDWYGNYASGSQTDPTGAVSGTVRVSRGGFWFYAATYLRSACRFSYNPYSSGNSGIGLRLVRP